MKTTNQVQNKILEKLTTMPYFPVEENIFTCLENPDETSYNRRARAYEFMVSSILYNKIMWGTSPKDYTDFSSRAVKSCKGLILDIGCGGLSATAEAYLQTQNPLILMDYSLEMLRFGKKRLLKKSGTISPNIVLLQGDALKLPFGKQSIDNVINFGMMHLFNNKEVYLKNIFHVLKEGGRFFFSSITSDRNFSKKYIQFLQSKNVLGEVTSSSEVLSLFPKNLEKLEYFTKGSFVFISGIK